MHEQCLQSAIVFPVKCQFHKCAEEKGTSTKLLKHRIQIVSGTQVGQPRKVRETAAWADGSLKKGRHQRLALREVYRIEQQFVSSSLEEWIRRGDCPTE
jgi:hypothetical protein